MSTVSSSRSRPRQSITSCLICLRDLRRFHKRERCINCIENQFCARCVINGWCKNCYSNKHTVCPICNHAIENGTRIYCSECHTPFCEKCGVNTQCKHCYIQSEKQELIKLVSSARTDISIHSIAIIVEYCIGYIIECCNQRDQCPNLIELSNKFEFVQCDAPHRAKGERLYKYIPKLNTLHTKLIYASKVRIFCGECTAHKLKACLNKHGGKCRNLEICGETKYGNICGDHAMCTNCEQRELLRETKYPSSKTRRWIYHTAPSTTVQQCIQCQLDFCVECIRYSGLYCKRCGEEQRIINNNNNTNVNKPVMTSSVNSSCSSTSCSSSTPSRTYQNDVLFHKTTCNADVPSNVNEYQQQSINIDDDSSYFWNTHNNTTSYSRSSVLSGVDHITTPSNLQFPATAYANNNGYVPPISTSMYESTSPLALNPIELSQPLIGCVGAPQRSMDDFSMHSPSGISILDITTSYSPSSARYMMTPTPTTATSAVLHRPMTVTTPLNLSQASPTISISMSSTQRGSMLTEVNDRRGPVERRGQEQQETLTERKIKRKFPKRGSVEYTQECVARVMRGRAPVISRD